MILMIGRKNSQSFAVSNIEKPLIPDLEELKVARLFRVVHTNGEKVSQYNMLNLSEL